MTVSADVPGFTGVDTTSLDVTEPADLVDLALAHAATLLPEWTPREGNVEVVLLEEFAVLVAALAERLETIVPAVTMQILEMSGLSRYAGQAAEVSVTVTLSDTLGHVVPAGTAVILGDPNADTVITASLASDVTVPAGSSTGTGTVVVDDVGIVPGLTTATPVLLIDAVAYVDTLTITAILSPGADPETDTQYLGRGSAWLTSMTQLLGRPDQFSARALTDVRVGRALAVNRWDGEGTVGEVAGALTVLLLAANGDPLSSENLEDVRASLADRAVTELQVYAQAPTVTTVPVEAAVTLQPGHVAAAVQTAVAQAVAGYLSVLSWPWGDRLNRSRLLQVIETVPGVDAATLTQPSADVVLGDQDLLRPGTITITVA